MIDPLQIIKNNIDNDNNNIVVSYKPGRGVFYDVGVEYSDRYKIHDIRTNLLTVSDIRNDMLFEYMVETNDSDIFFFHEFSTSPADVKNELTSLIENAAANHKNVVFIRAN